MSGRYLSANIFAHIFLANQPRYWAEEPSTLAHLSILSVPYMFRLSKTQAYKDTHDTMHGSSLSAHIFPQIRIIGRIIGPKNPVHDSTCFDRQHFDRIHPHGPKSPVHGSTISVP